jgi:small subunit ribosomal protein S5
MVIGDRKGKVGVGLAKGSDVSIAIGKAIAKAKKNIVNVPIIDGTIPHRVEIKNKASRLLIKPAKKGSGLKAGGVLRIILELVGIKDVVAKIIGTNNKVNNAKTAIKVLTSFKTEAIKDAKEFNKSVKKNDK